MTAVATDFLSFGLGRHACPGRFFASQEMKLMLAHIVMEYDVRVVGGKRPATVNIAGTYLPSENAKLEIRLRNQ
jgi:cytochrome P450